MGLKPPRKGILKRVQQAQREIESELQSAVTGYSLDKSYYFTKVVSSWAGKPRFMVKSQMTDKVYIASVVPSGEHADKFVWIDLGTGKYGTSKRSYMIRPVNASVLRFQTGYSPRTAPIAKYDVGNGGRSGDVVFAKEVEHPGIKSRLFNEKYDEKNEKQFRKSIDKAITKGLKA